MCDLGIEDAIIAKKRKRGEAKEKNPQRMACAGRSSARTRSSRTSGIMPKHRKIAHRPAQFALVVTFLLTTKLVDWRNRWCPGSVPIR